MPAQTSQPKVVDPDPAVSGKYQIIPLVLEEEYLQDVPVLFDKDCSR